MRSINRKQLAIFIPFTLLLVGSMLFYTFSLSPAPDLQTAICQPNDLGERFHSDTRLTTTFPHLGETAVESYTVTLIDQQLTYMVLDCTIIRYADELVAHRAFASVCIDKQDNLDMGDEACTYTANAPTNLAFRRNEFLVLMSGDIGAVTAFPAPAVDARLQMNSNQGKNWCRYMPPYFCDFES